MGARPRGARGVGGAPEGVQDARILTLSAQAIQAGIEPLRVPPPKVGDTPDAERAKVGREAGADRRQGLQLIRSSRSSHGRVLSIGE